MGTPDLRGAVHNGSANHTFNIIADDSRTKHMFIHLRKLHGFTKERGRQTHPRGSTFELLLVEEQLGPRRSILVNFLIIGLCSQTTNPRFELGTSILGR